MTDARSGARSRRGRRGVTRAAALIIVALVAGGCTGTADSEVGPVQTAPTTTAPTPATDTSAPPAQFEGMWSYELGDMSEDAELCGYLIIEEPYVHVLATEFGWDPDIDPGLRRHESDGSLVYYWVLLPRAGTRYDQRTRSLWVWDEGPMTDGDHVSLGGSQEGSTSVPGNFHRDKSWLATGMSPVERPC